MLQVYWCKQHSDNSVFKLSAPSRTPNVLQLRKQICRLGLFRKILAVYSQKYMKPVRMYRIFCGQNAYSFKVKAGGKQASKEVQ